MLKTKFPRTPHLPFSGSISSDDWRLLDLSQFYGKDVVITEKMDGENISIYKDSWHARSLDSKHKDYHSYLQNKIIPQIQAGLGADSVRLVGEYLYKRHTIPYDDLAGFFELFAVIYGRDSGVEVQPWFYVQNFSTLLGVPTVPELIHIKNFSKKDEKVLYDLANCFEKNGLEGFVIRNAARFPLENWSENVAKYVRKNYKPGFGEGFNKLKETQ